MRVRACRCLFCIFIVGFAVLCGYRQSRETMHTVKVLRAPDEEQAFENILCSCVRLQGEGHYGSGTIYRITEEQLIIITNKHVLQYFGQDGVVTFYDGKSAAGEILYLSEEYDLGFLAVDTASFSKEELSAYAAVVCGSDSYDKLKKNDCIFMVDIATDLKNPVKHSGEVMNPRKYLKDYGKEMFYGDAYAKEGMSGCGVFDEYGYYLALLSGGTQYNEIAAVPLNVIETEYKRIKK